MGTSEFVDIHVLFIHSWPPLWQTLGYYRNKVKSSYIHSLFRSILGRSLCFSIIRKFYLKGHSHFNWCFQTVVLEKTLESPLDCKEIQPVNPKGNQPWIFIGRTGAEAEAPILWPPDAKSWLLGRRRKMEGGRRREHERRRGAEDEMVGWHHWLNGHEFEQTLGDGEGHGNLACLLGSDTT